MGYTSAGVYTLAANSGTPFTANKTFIIGGALQSAAGGNIVQFAYERNTTTLIDLYTTDLSLGAANDLLNNTSFEVRIYP